MPRSWLSNELPELSFGDLALAVVAAADCARGDVDVAPTDFVIPVGEFAGAWLDPRTNSQNPECCGGAGAGCVGGGVNLCGGTTAALVFGGGDELFAAAVSLTTIWSADTSPTGATNCGCRIKPLDDGKLVLGYGETPGVSDDGCAIPLPGGAGIGSHAGDRAELVAVAF